MWKNSSASRRRLRYLEDSIYREKSKAQRRKYRENNKNIVNERERLRYQNDSAWREKRKASSQEWRRRKKLESKYWAFQHLSYLYNLTEDIKIC